MVSEKRLHPARYWHTIDKEKLQCDLCPRGCILRDGQRGFCFVRQNIRGQLIQTAYGRSTGFSIDPIEKKPLFHFYPGSPILSFGTIGCNLGCLFCQNWQTSKSQEDCLMSESALPQAIAKAAQRSGCKSVAFTYNDPIIFAEFAIDSAKACHELGIRTVAVTAGYINPEPRKEFFAPMDAVNVDLKSFDDKFYREMSSASLQPILDTLVYIRKQTNTWLEITNLIIPGKNDSPSEIEAMTKWIFENLGPEVPIHFSAFHPTYKLSDVPRTPPEILSQARDIAKKNGLRYVYTGNVSDSVGENTYCHSCGKRLIERNGYRIGEYNLVERNKCKFCKAICTGWF